MFMEKLKQCQVQETENGALGYVTTGKALVDLNFAIPSFREEINKDLFDEAYKENPNLAMRWLLYLRDIRQGVGERKSFREYILHFCENYPEMALKFVQLVPIEEYGRYDDIVYIAYYTRNMLIRRSLLDLLYIRFNQDLRLSSQGTAISLLAKWLPSINASSKETRKLANFLCKSWNLPPKEYRKRLSKLRAYLKVVEVQMSANDWEEIDYERVPSKANLNYRNAFIRHDEERRKEYLEDLRQGKAKINAQAMFLHDIVHAYGHNNIFFPIKEINDTLEELWKAQIRVKGLEDTIVVRDGSGSMGINIGNSNLTALDVANAISIYCAESNTGEFKDKVITFSHNARLIDLDGLDSLKEKINKLNRYNEYENTNIESVFNLILRTAVKYELKDIPKNVLIISDMEYDSACEDRYEQETLFKSISEKYKRYGYNLPKLIFWNVNSRTNTIPITENKNGVILLSGFSKNLMDIVVSSELNPYKALVGILNSPRYDVINLLS